MKYLSKCITDNVDKIGNKKIRSNNSEELPEYSILNQVNEIKK